MNLATLSSPIINCAQLSKNPQHKRWKTQFIKKSLRIKIPISLTKEKNEIGNSIYQKWQNMLCCTFSAFTAE